MKAIITFFFLLMISASFSNALKCHGLNSLADVPSNILQVDFLIDELMGSDDPNQIDRAHMLHDLVYESSPTMIIHEGGVIFSGESDPVVVDIKPSMIDQLYNMNPVYSQIQMIRIMVHSPTDMNWVIKAGDLLHFSNLSYIFIHTTYEICPENPDNAACHATKLKDLTTGLGSDSDTTLIYKVSSIM